MPHIPKPGMTNMIANKSHADALLKVVHSIGLVETLNILAAHCATLAESSHKLGAYPAELLYDRAGFSLSEIADSLETK